jgi:hypothetical protein
MIMNQTLHKNMNKKKRISYSDIEEIGSGKKETKMNTPLDFFSNFSLFITDGEPKTIREAVNSEDEKLWKNAMV